MLPTEIKGTFQRNGCDRALVASSVKKEVVFLASVSRGRGRETDGFLYQLGERLLVGGSTMIPMQELLLMHVGDWRADELPIVHIDGIYFRTKWCNDGRINDWWMICEEMGSSGAIPKLICNFPVERCTVIRSRRPRF